MKKLSIQYTYTHKSLKTQKDDSLKDMNKQPEKKHSQRAVRKNMNVNCCIYKSTCRECWEKMFG